MTYATTQFKAKDRVIMKRRLRVLGFVFRNELPTIDLALMLRNADPSFVFPVNIAIDLRDYDRDNNPQYTAKQIQLETSPLSFLLDGGQLNQRIIESIQSLADNLVWFLNDGWDKDAAIAQVFSETSHNTPEVKELVLRTVLG
jgi:hypothetical protein